MPKSINTKSKWLISCISFVLFLLLILLIKVVDVNGVGPAGTAIGLSALNKGFHDAVGVHKFLYYITQLLGYAALLVVGLFAVAGVVQWIRRKSLLKVDKEVLCLGGLYVIMMALYVFFEKVIVNFRPILEEGQTLPEASFPSSHTMLACVVFGSMLLILDKYLTDPKMLRVVKLVLWVIIILSVLGRLFCGVHWLTDILGAVWISITLIFAFSAMLDIVRK